MSTTDWHLPRELPTTEQQRHLSSASMEIELQASIAVDLQQSLREFSVEWGTLYSRESGGTGLQISSVQFRCSLVSDFLWPHESQHARPPCPSSTPRIYPNSCPSSRWCHPAISSSVIPFSSCPQSLPASKSFPMSQLSSHEVAKVLEFQLQHQSLQWTPRTDPL